MLLPPLTAGQTYNVTFVIDTATITQLESSGNTYPKWIISDYLELPSNFSPKIIELAQKITQDAATPYSKTIAITTYLRRNYSYTSEIESSPKNIAPIEWFLFDYKKGFCNYYATAEVLLLRAVGIPSRWSIGYSRGELSYKGTFIVRQRNYHSWPEVYFPNFGWIIFEPTVTQPIITRFYNNHYVDKKSLMKMILSKKSKSIPKLIQIYLLQQKVINT